jgi:hypothetical protein
VADAALGYHWIGEWWVGAVWGWRMPLWATTGVGGRQLMQNSLPSGSVMTNQENGPWEWLA